jgi:curli biogenesis system outer membrane secretion channel CsgG
MHSNPGILESLNPASPRAYRFSRAAIVVVSLLSYLLAVQCASAPVKPYEVSNSFRSRLLEQRDIRRIAVLPFDNAGDDRVAGPLVAEELNLQLGKLGVFDLIERTRITELLKEQDLDTLERFDESTAARIGKLLGVQAVVMGSVTKFRRHPSDKQDTVVIVEHENAHHHHSMWGDEGWYHDHYSHHHGDYGEHGHQDYQEHHRDSDSSSADVWAAIAVVALVITLVGIIYLATRPHPTAEIGANMRLVDVETGEVLWQAGDMFQGNRPRIQALVQDKEDKARLVTDIEYLNQVFCREMVRTLLVGDR